LKKRRKEKGRQDLLYIHIIQTLSSKPHLIPFQPTPSFPSSPPIPHDVSSPLNSTRPKSRALPSKPLFHNMPPKSHPNKKSTQTDRSEILQSILLPKESIGTLWVVEWWTCFEFCERRRALASEICNKMDYSAMHNLPVFKRKPSIF